MPTDGAGAAWVVGSLYGLLSTPDLDQIEEVGNKVGGYYGQYVIRETFGGGKLGATIEYIWWSYWQPYARFCVHRGFISHFPVFSTVVRLIYCFPVTYILAVLLGDNKIYAFVALVCSDTIHYVMDLKIWRNLGFFRQ